ncbi:MAG: hypothetical protein KF718_15140 [Polyangiaceae bacterium]|nr:hypothetical protein [Polyangiaceae bacterium]
MRWRWWGWFGAALVGWLAAACGCGTEKDDPQASGGSAGTDASAGGTGGHWPLPDSAGVGGSPTDGAIPCPEGPELPPDVPDGWVRFPVFGCKYKVYVPPEPSLLPPPLQWEECTDLGPDPYTCTQLVTPWPHNGQPVGGQPRAWKDENGKVILQFRQMSGTTVTHAYTAVAAYADGPMLQAIRVSEQTNQGPVLAVLPNGGAAAPMRALWRFSDYEGSSTANVTEIRGGPVTNPMADLIVRYEKGDVLSAGGYGGPKYVALVGARLHIREWDGTDLGQQYVGLDIANTTWANAETLIWNAQSAVKSHLYRWTPSGGAEVIHSYGDDFSKGAASPATDGTDLVWLEGEGRDVGGSSSFFPTMHVVTSKLPASSAPLEPKRLRSWKGEAIWNAAGAVGCGYAAYSMPLTPVNAPLDQRLLIVRLSDGVSWELKSPADNHWNWGQPLTIDCDELITTWGVGFGNFHIRRIRLDSLGPGTPPD